MSRVSVIKVSGELRVHLLRQEEDVYIQGEDDEYEWKRPTEFEASVMRDFLMGNYPSSPKKFWLVRVGTRAGYDREGVYIHQSHFRRYFGIDREKANIVLLTASPETAPLVTRCQHQAGESSTEKFMRSMLNGLPGLSDDVRYKVLYASFVRADKNKNGLLSRPELSTVLRKVMYTLSSRDIQDVMRAADTDEDGQINYKEFADWLQRSQDTTMQKHFYKSLADDADIVKATFRMWDKNGDGLISNKKLTQALCKIFPNASATQLTALTDTIDSNDSGDIDYGEFVDFLFHRHQEK